MSNCPAQLIEKKRDEIFKRVVEKNKGWKYAPKSEISEAEWCRRLGKAIDIFMSKNPKTMPERLDHIPRH